jgi:hypothetical protein
MSTGVDLIIAIDGRPVDGQDALWRALNHDNAGLRAGSTVTTRWRD